MNYDLLSVPWWYRTPMGKPLLKIYLLFLFCTLSFILSLLTIPIHGDMLCEGGVCDTCFFFREFRTVTAI